jgi:hypothetical protein
MEGGGIRVWELILTSSGDGDSLLTQTAVEVDMAFSFCDSRNKSASFYLQKAQTGDESNSFNDATGDFAEDMVTSLTASSSASSSSSTEENLQPFLPFKHLRHLLLSLTTSQSFLTLRQ